MAYIVEEIKHPYFRHTIEIMEAEKNEEWSGNICYETDFGQSEFTPDELIELGEWLIEKAKQVKKEYTSKGRKRNLKPTK